MRQRTTLVALFAAALLSACIADGPPPTGSTADNAFDEELGDWAEDPLPDGVQVDKAVDCSARYVPTQSTDRIGQQQDVDYDGVGSRCAGGATAGAVDLGDHLRRHFGERMALSVPGRGVQIYNCRSVRGSSGNSMHSEGRAVDIFIPMDGTRANNRLGDTIANWLIRNAEYIGVQMLIWDRTIWTASRSPQGRCYTGTHPHNDHIHLEISRKAAARQTPFFRDLANGLAGSPDVANTPTAWVGSSCRHASDCDFVHDGRVGTCYPDTASEADRGVCTFSCEGYCPDRGGHVSTFCAETADLGGRAGAGTCVSLSATANRSCAAINGAAEVLADRYIGSSGASRAQRTVCAPVGVSVPDPDPTPDPDPDPDPMPDPTGNDVCTTAPQLPLGGLGQSCNGVAAEQWRCACSQSLATPVSQVCRGGVWINYQADPRDCATCDGAYSTGCEPADPGNGGICTDASLPLSEHNLPCTDFPNNHWRCACSNNLDTTVSQVCRSGRWVNYETDPRDCTRCDGPYTSGCEGR